MYEVGREPDNRELRKLFKAADAQLRKENGGRLDMGPALSRYWEIAQKFWGERGVPVTIDDD